MILVAPEEDHYLRLLTFEFVTLVAPEKSLEPRSCAHSIQTPELLPHFVFTKIPCEALQIESFKFPVPSCGAAALPLARGVNRGLTCARRDPSRLQPTTRLETAPAIRWWDSQQQKRHGAVALVPFQIPPLLYRYRDRRLRPRHRTIKRVSL